MVKQIFSFLFLWLLFFSVYCVFSKADVRQRWQIIKNLGLAFVLALIASVTLGVIVVLF